MNRLIEDEINTPKHYDNTKGSLYQFAEEQGLNAYEFDLIKRIVKPMRVACGCLLTI